MTRPRRSLLLVAAAVLTLPLVAACSGDEPDFCTQGEAAIAQGDATGALIDDPEAFAEGVTEVRKIFDDTDAPDEIADDWGALTDMYDQLDEALRDIDVTDSAAFTAALNDFAEVAGSQELADSSDAVSTYFSAHCGATSTP